MRRNQPEKAEQRQILNLVGWLGGKAYVLGTHRRKGDYQGTMQTPGAPDLLLFLPDHRVIWTVSRADMMPHRAKTFRLVAVEVKAGKNTETPEQAEFRGFCEKAGIAHILGGYQAFVDWCLQHGYLTPDNLAHYRINKGGSGNAHLDADR